VTKPVEIYHLEVLRVDGIIKKKMAIPAEFKTLYLISLLSISITYSFRFIGNSMVFPEYLLI